MRITLWNTVEKQVMVASPKENVLEVIKKMGNYHTIPVVDENGYYLGVINKTAIYEKMLFQNYNAENKTVSEEILTYDYITEKDKMEDVLGKLEQARYLFLPLVEETEKGLKFEGIIPNKKILMLFDNMLAKHKNGVSISILMYDSIGQLYRIAKVLKKEGISIISISVIDLEVLEQREIVLKLNITEDQLPEVKELLREEKIEVRW